MASTDGRFLPGVNHGVLENLLHFRVARVRSVQQRNHLEIETFTNPLASILTIEDPEALT